jgi:hypothetical protein
MDIFIKTTGIQAGPLKQLCLFRDKNRHEEEYHKTGFHVGKRCRPVTILRWAIAVHLYPCVTLKC